MKTTSTCLRRFVTLFLSVMFLTALCSGAQGAASITTDQLDYPPFTDVFVSGAGFAPGEGVQLSLETLGADGVTWTMLPSSDEWPNPWIVTADVNGKISDEWYVYSQDFLGVSFRLTAVGQTSGETAVTRFTDSAQKIGNVSVTSQTPNPVAPGSSATFLVTVTRKSGNGSNGKVDANVTVTFQDPAPIPAITVSPNPLVVSLANKQTVGYGTLTMTVPSGVAPGTYTFTNTAVRVQGNQTVTTTSLGQIVVGTGPRVGPLAVADTRYAAINSVQAVNINVLANDLPGSTPIVGVVEIEGNPAIVGTAVPTVNGSATLRADGTIDYTPDALNQVDSFSYTIKDQNNLTSTATVTVTVAPYPSVTVDPVYKELCAGGIQTITATVIGGTSPYQYLWNNGATTPSIDVTANGLYTVVVTDQNGNGDVSAPASSQIVFGDTTPPAIPVLPDVTGQCEATIPAAPTTTDNCAGTITGTTTDSLTRTTQGTSIVTWHFDDGNGQVVTAQQRIVVQDTIAPVANAASLPDVIGQCSAALPTAPKATDACEGEITGTPDKTGPFGPGDTTITWTYTDSHGNSSTQTQLVKVHDTVAPVANAASLPDVTGQCSAQLPAAPKATDACDGEITGSPDKTGPFGQGDTTITWTYTDSHGNSSTQTQLVKVHDTIAPVANLASLPDVTGQCTAQLPAAPKATDACDGQITGTPDKTGPFGQGDATITWTYTDSRGNSSTQTQLVKVHDTIAPVANLASLPDVIGQCSAVLPTAPKATDACDGEITGTPDKTGPFGQGDTTITWTYTDSHGNSSTQTQQVKVHDTIAPVANLASLPDVTGQCSAQLPTAPKATDACDGQITGSPDKTGPFGQGDTTITWTYTDSHGNSSTQTQQVKVHDTTPPAIPVLPDVTGQCEATIPAAPTTTDNCAGTITGTTTDSLTRTTQGTSTVTWRFDDGNGQVVTAQQRIVVHDTTAPTITCPPDITAICGQVVNKTNATWGDNCSYTVTWMVDGADPGSDSVLLGVGCHTITWKITDAGGNSSTCSQNISVDANLGMTYSGDNMVFTGGPTVSSAPVSLSVHVASTDGQAPCVALTNLQVQFEVWATAGTPSSPLKSVQVPVNANGDAGVLVTLSADQNTAQTYEIRAHLLYGTCDVGNGDLSGQIVTVDYGSTARRVVGGGWIGCPESENGKGTFGFVAGYNTKNKVTLTGNSVFMLHSVLANNAQRYDWKIKDTAWNYGSLSFYHNATLGGAGTMVDSGRFTCKCNVQQIDPRTGAVLGGGYGNGTLVVDVFDGDLYSPAKKDAYCIKIYDGNNNLWWQSSTSMPLLGAGGPGGGNVKVFNTK